MNKLGLLLSILSLFVGNKKENTTAATQTTVEKPAETPVDEPKQPIASQCLNIGKLSNIGYTNLIIQTCEKFGLTSEQTAYVVATVYHETAGTMKPIEEWGRGKKYVYGNWILNTKGVKICPKNGNRTSFYTQKECPHLFYGRGFVQLTWYDNYAKVGKILHSRGYIDNPNLFVVEPEKAMDPEYSALILVIGMVEGIFTGKSLKDYINDSKCDFRDARRIINGLDKCDLVASYAKSYIV